MGMLLKSLEAHSENSLSRPPTTSTTARPPHFGRLNLKMTCIGHHHHHHDGLILRVPCPRFPGTTRLLVVGGIDPTRSPGRGGLPVLPTCAAKELPVVLAGACEPVWAAPRKTCGSPRRPWILCVRGPASSPRPPGMGHPSRLEIRAGPRGQRGGVMPQAGKKDPWPCHPLGIPDQSQIIHGCWRCWALWAILELAWKTLLGAA